MGVVTLGYDGVLAFNGLPIRAVTVSNSSSSSSSSSTQTHETFDRFADVAFVSSTVDARSRTLLLLAVTYDCKVLVALSVRKSAFDLGFCGVIGNGDDATAGDTAFAMVKAKIGYPPNTRFSSALPSLRRSLNIHIEAGNPAGYGGSSSSSHMSRFGSSTSNV